MAASPKKTELPILTRAESEVMHRLWKGGPATVTQIREGLGRDVAYTTVLTILRILETKGYATHAADPDGGRAHVYSAAVAEAGVRKKHVRDLVDRLFGGRAESLVTGLIDSDELDPETLRALREKIDAQLGKASPPPARKSGTKKGEP